jgi:hypothetical protein
MGPCGSQFGFVVYRFVVTYITCMLHIFYNIHVIYVIYFIHKR